MQLEKEGARARAAWARQGLQKGTLVPSLFGTQTGKKMETSPLRLLYWGRKRPLTRGLWESSFQE